MEPEARVSGGRYLSPGDNTKQDSTIWAQGLLERDRMLRQFTLSQRDAKVVAKRR